MLRLTVMLEVCTHAPWKKSTIIFLLAHSHATGFYKHGYTRVIKCGLVCMKPYILLRMTLFSYFQNLVPCINIRKCSDWVSAPKLFKRAPFLRGFIHTGPGHMLLMMMNSMIGETKRHRVEEQVEDESNLDSSSVPKIQCSPRTGRWLQTDMCVHTCLLRVSKAPFPKS